MPGGKQSPTSNCFSLLYVNRSENTAPCLVKWKSEMTWEPISREKAGGTFIILILVSPIWGTNQRKRGLPSSSSSSSRWIIIIFHFLISLYCDGDGWDPLLTRPMIPFYTISLHKNNYQSPGLVTPNKQINK